MPSLTSLIILFVLAACTMAAVDPPESASDIYVGEPLSEAIYDLSGAVLVANERVSASPLVRRDVFRFRDGRLLEITSRASKIGVPYSIEMLRITPSAKDSLSKKVPSVGSVKITQKDLRQ